MEFHNEAFAFIPGVGVSQLEWNASGAAQLTRVYTGEVVGTCGYCPAIDLHQDEGPNEVLRLVARCQDHESAFSGPYTELAGVEVEWADPSMYRRAHSEADIKLSRAELLCLLMYATKADWWRLQVEMGGPSGEDRVITLQARNPDDVFEWLEQVQVRAGDVRMMLRAAVQLMPRHHEAAEPLRALLQPERHLASAAIAQLSPAAADAVLQYTVFGGEVVS
ncbi:hypothetical protein [Streptomyces sp. NPDC051162]|uniref:hypothetical protein n=1 Tax=Streptomyces sp. NPDC051162 TaxID=3154747 RepID=UPI00341268EB